MLLWCLTGYYCHRVIKPNQENYPGFGVVFWLLISSVKIFTGWDCKFFRWEFHGRFWNDVSCTFEYLQMVGGQINLPKEFFAKLHHLYPSRFSQKKFHQWFDWFKKDACVASHEIVVGNFKSPSAHAGWTKCFESKIWVLTLANEKNMGVGRVYGQIPSWEFGIPSSQGVFFWSPVSAWGLVVGYHCGISNDFSTALGREAQGSTVSWRFVVGDSKLKHDFDEAIKGFFCGKMALYKAFSRWFFFIYCNPAVFKAWWEVPFKEV